MSIRTSSVLNVFLSITHQCPLFIFITPRVWTNGTQLVIIRGASGFSSSMVFDWQPKWVSLLVDGPNLIQLYVYKGQECTGGPLILSVSSTVFFNYYLIHNGLLLQLGFVVMCMVILVDCLGKKEAEQLMRFYCSSLSDAWPIWLWIWIHRCLISYGRLN